jgi:hypothetical protein
MVTTKRVLVILDRGSEQGVDKCGFSQAGFTYLRSSSSIIIGTRYNELIVTLVMKK